MTPSGIAAVRSTGIRLQPEPEPLVFVGAVDEARECERQRHPDDGPDEALAGRDDVGLTMEDAEIDGEQQKNERDE